MLNTSARISPAATHSRVEALEEWREAAALVAVRWQYFVEARGNARRRAFASYVAALDAEGAAACELAELAA